MFAANTQMTVGKASQIMKVIESLKKGGHFRSNLSNY